MAFAGLTQIDSVCWGWPVLSIILIAVHSVFNFDPPVVTVVVGPDKTQFAVHKQALEQTQAGQFFSRAFSNGFRESHDGKLELPADDPDAFNHFVQWLYNSCTGAVHAGLIEGCDNPQALRLYIFAHKYLIPELQDLIVFVMFDRVLLCKWRKAGIDGGTLTQFLASVPESQMHRLLSRWFIIDAFGTYGFQKSQVDDLKDSLPDDLVRLTMREMLRVNFDKSPNERHIMGSVSDYLLRKTPPMERKYRS